MAARPVTTGPTKVRVNISLAPAIYRDMRAVAMNEKISVSAYITKLHEQATSTRASKRRS